MAPTADGLIERIVQLTEQRHHAIGRHSRRGARRQHPPRPRQRAPRRRTRASPMRFRPHVDAQKPHRTGTRSPFTRSTFPVLVPVHGFNPFQGPTEPERGTWNARNGRTCIIGSMSSRSRVLLFLVSTPHRRDAHCRGPARRRATGAAAGCVAPASVRGCGAAHLTRLRRRRERGPGVRRRDAGTRRRARSVERVSDARRSPRHRREHSRCRPATSVSCCPASSISGSSACATDRRPSAPASRRATSSARSTTSPRAICRPSPARGCSAARPDRRSSSLVFRNSAAEPHTVELDARGTHR